MSTTDYTCRNVACGNYGKPIPDAYARLAENNCLFCGEPLSVIASNLSETTLRVIASYPYPIAFPLQTLQRKVDVEARAKCLVDVFTNTLKIQAMVVQSEYLKSPIVDEELTGIILRDLARPLVSAWSKFLEAALPRLESAGHKFFVSELKTAYESAETKRKQSDLVDIPGKGYYDLDGDFIETNSKLGLVQALISYRNKFAHGLNQPEEESRKELDFYLGVLDVLLDEMAWMAEYPLLKHEDGKVWSLMGAVPKRVDTHWPEEVDTGLSLLSPGGERALALFPLFIVPREYRADASAEDDLLIYDQYTGKRLIYVSPRGHHRQIESTLRPWRNLLQAKEVVLSELGPKDLTVEEIGRRATRVRCDTEELLHASRKVLKGIYVNREDPERHLRFYPASSFPLAVVTSQAGGGKTCLLHHLASEWAKEGMSVVLLRATEVKTTDFMSALRDTLRLSDEVDAKSLAERGASEDRPIIVILDGLNEHGEREALLASILAVAEEVRETRHLRLVLSWRCEQSDWAAAAKEYADHFLPGPESSTTKDDEIPQLRLGPWSNDEVAALWKSLVKSDHRRFLQPQRFRYEQVYEKSRAVTKLLKNPLLVRIFLESFIGEKLPARLSHQDIFEQWLKKLGERTRDDNRFLYDLARILLERGSQAVELDSLYHDPRTAETVRRTDDVASPFNRLLREGVLMRTSSIDVSFTMDRFFEQAAGAVLVLDGKADRPEGLVAALNELKEHCLAKSIVEVALTRRVAEEGREYLWDFINAVPPSAASMAGELVGRLVEETREAETIAAELMACPSEGDIEAAIQAGEYLAGENLFLLQRDFLGAVVQSAAETLPASEAMADLISAAANAAFTLHEWETCRVWNQQALAMRHGLFGEQHADVADSYHDLGSLLSELGEHQQAREYYEKSLAIRIKIYGEQHADVANSYSSLGVLLSDLGEHQQAREYYEKRLAILIKIYGEQHADVATSYNNLGVLLSDLGEYQQAREYCGKSLAIRIKIYGEQHAEVANSYKNLGTLLSSFGEYQQAREYYEKSLAIRIKIYGEQHADVASTRALLGDALASLKQYDDAEKQYRLAAEAGNARSMHTIGRRSVLSEDEGHQREGIAWLEQAAEAGNRKAAQLLEGLAGLDLLEQVNIICQRTKDQQAREYYETLPRRQHTRPVGRRTSQP